MPYSTKDPKRGHPFDNRPHTLGPKVGIVYVLGAPGIVPVIMARWSKQRAHPFPDCPQAERVWLHDKGSPTFIGQTEDGWLLGRRRTYSPK